MSIFGHYLRYMNASILMIIAGMISFPIIARNLPFEELGILGYYEALVIFLTSALKLGSQHSVLRFYSRFHVRRKAPSRVFFTSFVMVPIAITLALTALALAGVYLWDWTAGVAEAPYLYITLVLGAGGAITSIMIMVLMAQERSRAASGLQVINRFLQLLLVVGAILLLGGTAMNVFLAQVVAVSLAAAVALVLLARIGRYSLAAFRWQELKRSWGYGIPLIVNELLWTALEVTDRIMLRHLGPGFQAVGVLSIGSGLARYVIVLLLVNVRSAFEPVVNRLYESEGASAVVELKTRISRILAYMAVLLGVGVVLGGADLFVLFAGEDKAASAPIFQTMSVVFIAYSSLSIVAYGLKLHHRSVTMMSIRAAAFVINIILNLILIPVLGLWGAVTATVASFLVSGALELVFCPRVFRLRLFSLPWVPALGLGAVLVFAMVGVDQWIALSPLPRLAVLAALSLLIYVLPLLVMEPDFRRVLRLEWLRRRGAG